MKLYEKYLINKNKYNNYVVLIKSGIFIDTFDKGNI